MRTIVAARRYPNSEASLTNSGMSVKNFGNRFLSTITITMNIRPIKADVETVTMTEKLAAFGWLAPSSFDTRTLKQ